MSHGLVRRGIRLGFHADRKDIKEVDNFLFELIGDFALHSPVLQKSGEDKKYQNELIVEECHSIELNIDIKKPPGTRIEYFKCEFVPIGFFHLRIEQLQLTNEAKQRVENLKTKEEAFKFMKDFGSHFSTGIHHYGGKNIYFSAKTHGFSEKAEYRDFYEKDIRILITKNPELARIISRGPAKHLNGVWQFLKKDFPFQSDLLRLAWIQNTDSVSDLVQSIKRKLLDETNKKGYVQSDLLRLARTKKNRNEEHLLQQKMQGIQVKELDSNAEETPEKVQKHQKTEEGKSMRELRSYIHEKIKKWYESEAMARAIVTIKTQQWPKVPTTPEYFHSLIDLLLIEIEEEDGIQAVFDIIGDFRELKIRLIKRNIEIDSKYTFFDFINEISNLLEKSCDQGKELLSFDSFLSLLRRSFYAEEIAEDFELYSSEWQQKNIPFARPELEDIIKMVNEIDNSSEIQDTINEKLWDSFINNKICGKTILARLCEELCPLCKSPCLKENNHEENHDCFHFPGGIVGHYYWKHKSFVGQKVSKYINHGSKSIRTQDYVSILNDKEKFGQERFLSNYSCASAHE
ncbi:hypothetical protein QYM36_011764, partial [Artemia franciscana]